jgi:protein-disulfide isomerase
MSKLRIPVTERDHARGSENSELVVVEYGDYQCPFCGEAESKIARLEHLLSGIMKRVFRHFPLTQVHEFAFPAAMSAEAASNQGKFWEMHESLFANQESLELGIFEELAEQIGLDLAQFRNDLRSDSLQSKIKEDFMGGVRSGVNGTPSFFLNGVKFEGPLEAEALLEMIKAA